MEGLKVGVVRTYEDPTTSVKTRGSAHANSVGASPMLAKLKVFKSYAHWPGKLPEEVWPQPWPSRTGWHNPKSSPSLLSDGLS